jgi:hypothetical protein
VAGGLQSFLTICLTVRVLWNRSKNEPPWEGKAVKYIGFALLLSFVICTVLIAPFLENSRTAKNIPAPITVTVAGVPDLEAANRKIAELEGKTKARLLSERERSELVRALSGIQNKGTVELRPDLESNSVEYAAQLKEVFKEAGFTVIGRNFGEFTVDGFVAWGFTGERILFHDKENAPGFGADIQQVFKQKLDRAMLVRFDERANIKGVTIAVGARP